MRRITRPLSLALAALLIISASTPVASRAQTPRVAPCDNTIQTGTFRMTVFDPKGEPREAMLVLEKLDGCLAATFIADGSPASSMDIISIANGVLTAKLHTNIGDTRITLTLDEKSVNGSITDGRKTWKVAGRKTA